MKVKIFTSKPKALMNVKIKSLITILSDAMSVFAAVTSKLVSQARLAHGRESVVKFPLVFYVAYLKEY